MPDDADRLSDASRTMVQALERRLCDLERRTDIADIRRVATGWAQRWRQEVTDLRLQAATHDDPLAAARLNARAKALEECADVVQDLA